VSRTLRTADFDYEAPSTAIAQRPLPDRAASRLLVLERHSGRILHRTFRDFPSLIEPGDVLVVNASRVIPARLTGQRENGRPAEILLVHREPDGSWVTMVHPGGKLKAGRRVRFGTADPRSGTAAELAEVEIVEVLGGGLRRVRFHGMDAREVMTRWGAVPLPPYIHRAPESADRERYQTVYARENGSAAAPTAGLHFTPELMAHLEIRGIEFARVTLHVGLDTFAPVTEDDPLEHEIHTEWCELSAETAAQINRVKASGGRIIAVGTTSVRTLESAARTARTGEAVGIYSGPTDLFILPGYPFTVVDAMITNFHLPKSTLLMLVSAFAGRERILDTYAEAVRLNYRFFSFGDAMIIL